MQQHFPSAKVLLILREHRFSQMLGVIPARMHFDEYFRFQRQHDEDALTNEPE